jgi:hypothetical protein
MLRESWLGRFSLLKGNEAMYWNGLRGFAVLLWCMFSAPICGFIAFFYVALFFAQLKFLICSGR